MNYDYEKLIEEFCDYKKYNELTIKKVMSLKPYIIKNDLFNIDNELKVRDIIIEDVGATTYNSINNITVLFRSFCAWGIEQKGFPIKYFYEREILKPSNMMYYYSKTHISVSIDNNELERIINKLHSLVLDDMSLYYEVLLRLYYIGVTTDELSKLKKDDVSLVKKTINLNGKSVSLSDKICKAISNYENFNNVKGNWRSEIRNLFQDSFIRDSLAKDTKNSKSFYQMRTCKIFIAISKHLGREITKEDVYNNGFLTFLENKYSKEDVVDLFIDKYPRGKGLKGEKGNNLRRRMDILEECAKEYRMKLSGQRVRRKLYPYVISRYQM